MITILDNNLIVFRVSTRRGADAFCNIQDLNQVVKDLGCREGYFTIYTFFASKMQRVTKRDLPLYFEANKLTMDFHY